jgi:hypothetical protein
VDKTLLLKVVLAVKTDTKHALKVKVRTGVSPYPWFIYCVKILKNRDDCG